MESNDYLSICVVAFSLLAATWLAGILHALAELSWGRLRKLNPQKQKELIDCAEGWIEKRDTYRILVRFLSLINMAFMAVAAYHLAMRFMPAATAGDANLIHAAVAIAGAILLLIGAEALGNGLLAVRPWPLLKCSMPVLRLLAAIFHPAIMPTIFLHRRLDAWREDADGEERSTTEDEIMSLVEQDAREKEENGGLEDSERRMIRGIFDLDESLVKEIMTPRVDVNSLAVESSIDVLKATIGETGHSRIPIFQKSVDDIIGIIYAKDLLTTPADAKLKPLLHEPVFIPETKNVRDLLDEFRQSRKQIAVVLDEYGGTAGLVTIEDILEEIVGEIRDEYDVGEEEEICRIQPDGCLIADARTPIDDINDLLNISIPEDEEYDTIGGYVSSEIGRIPDTNEVFQIDGLEVVIIAADQRKIELVKLRPCDKDATADQNNA